MSPLPRLLATNSIDSGRLFDRQIPGFGFQVKERPWHESPETLIEDLCRSRRVASDTGVGSTKDVSLHLKNLRVNLNERDAHKFGNSACKSPTPLKRLPGTCNGDKQKRK
ncbi:MAG: hypothetical protein R3C11_03980 [Planctomycetaceae bacterium]